MILTEEEYHGACWGDPPEGFEFTEEVEGDSGRWVTDIMTVFKHTESGEYWAVEWCRANTERQEHEYYDKTPFRVYPKEVTTIEWSRVPLADPGAE